MLPVPSDSQDRDTGRWLSQIFLHDAVERTPFRLLGVERGVVTAERLLPDPTRPRIELLVPQNCFAHWPALGSFNPKGENGAVHIERRSVRQWERSLTSAVLDVKKLDLMPGRPHLYAGAYVRTPYVHDPFVPADEARAAVESGAKESVAITRRVALGRGLCTYKNAIFVDGELAGTLVNRELVLSRPEVSTLLLKVFGEGYVVRESSEA
jgi:hypothetical protein